MRVTQPMAGAVKLGVVPSIETLVCPPLVVCMTSTTSPSGFLNVRG